MNIRVEATVSTTQDQSKLQAFMSCENRYSWLTMKIAISLNLNYMLKHFYTVQKLYIKDICLLNLVNCVTV